MAGREAAALARFLGGCLDHDELIPTFERIVQLGNLSRQAGAGNSQAGHRGDAVEALAEVARLLTGLVGWAARECGAPTLTDAAYAALPPKARREYAAARLRLGLPVMPAAAAAELAHALEARSAGEVAPLLEAPDGVRRAGNAPHSLDMARLELLGWVERQVGLDLANRRIDAARQAVAAVGHAGSPEILDKWRSRLRESLGDARVDAELGHAQRTAEDEARRLARLAASDPRSPSNPAYLETMEADERARLQGVADRYKTARAPA